MATTKVVAMGGSVSARTLRQSSGEGCGVSDVVPVELGGAGRGTHRRLQVLQGLPISLLEAVEDGIIEHVPQVVHQSLPVLVLFGQSHKGLVSLFCGLRSKKVV